MAPIPGELWAISSTIKDGTGSLIEHSRVPVLVVIARQVSQLFEVIPVSFESDLVGPFDVAIGQVFGRDAIAETWLRMPVSARALQESAGRLDAEAFRRIQAELRRAASSSTPALPEDDPRRSYRQEERLRVIFAMAGTGEEIELPDEADTDTELNDLTEKALRLKRGAWRTADADGADIPGFTPASPGPVASDTPSHRR